MNYVLDSNVFDFILDNNINIEDVNSIGSIYVTNVQLSEISNIPDKERRDALLSLIDLINPEKLFLESGIWINDLRWDDDQQWIDEICDACISLLGNATKKIPWKDALIGEVAKKKNMVLITSDKKFSARAKRNGITTAFPKDIFQYDKA